MHVKILTIAFLFFSSTQLSAQIQKEFLSGTWQCYHKELEDGSTGEELTLDGKPYSCEDLIIELRTDFTGKESIGGLEFEYTLKDSLLKIGNRTYVVEALKKNDLILRDYDPDGMKLAVFRRKFRKETDE